MNNKRLRGILLGVVLIALSFVMGCTTHRHHQHGQTLQAPSGAVPEAVRAMDEGNRLFATEQWEAARRQYETAIQIQPSLAEAHYNLALTLQELGNPKGARHHYLEAANLAPGHKVIWNSPPLRPHGNVQTKSESEPADYGSAGHSH